MTEDFADLYAALSPRVRLFCLRRTDEATCDDVVAQTFLVAWRRRDDLPDSPLPWLLGVARNLLREHWRSQVRQRELAPPRWQELAAEPAEVTAVERAAALGALAALPEADREVLLLVVWDGLSATDAAEVLGCSRGAFAVRLHRARRRLESAAAGGEEAPVPGLIPSPSFTPSHPSATPEEETHD